VTLAPKARDMITVRQNLDTDRPPPRAGSRAARRPVRHGPRLPQREQIDTQVREQLIVELYSK
jgi:ribosomal protein S4